MGVVWEIAKWSCLRLSGVAYGSGLLIDEGGIYFGPAGASFIWVVCGWVALLAYFG